MNDDATLNEASENDPIEICFVGPNGAYIEFAADVTEEALDAFVPDGWAIDYSAAPYELPDGRYRRPIYEKE